MRQQEVEDRLAIDAGNLAAPTARGAMLVRYLTAIATMPESDIASPAALTAEYFQFQFHFVTRTQRTGPAIQAPSDQTACQRR